MEWIVNHIDALYINMYIVYVYDYKINALIELSIQYSITSGIIGMRIKKQRSNNDKHIKD